MYLVLLSGNESVFRNTRVTGKFREPYFSLSSLYDTGLLGRSLAEDTRITIGFRSRFWISDNRSLSSDTERNNSSTFPHGSFSFVVLHLKPEKNL